MLSTGLTQTFNLLNIQYLQKERAIKQGVPVWRQSKDQWLPGRRKEELTGRAQRVFRDYLQHTKWWVKVIMLLLLLLFSRSVMSSSLQPRGL